MTAERAIKEPCRVATTEDIALSGLQTIDAITLVAGDRVLVRAQDGAADNGIYVAGSGAWSRSTDFDAAAEVVGGELVAVTSGGARENTLFRVIGEGEFAPGTDPIAFSRMMRGQPLSPKDFGAVGNGDNETFAVNAALASLDPEVGGIVEVDFDVKFYTTPPHLTLPKRSMLRFRMDSDLARPNPEDANQSYTGTNEYVTLIANANDDGIVNEDRLTASYSIGRITDLRSDIRGHAAFEGLAQEFDNPIVPMRIHDIFMHEQAGVWRTVMERFRHYEGATGVYQHTWRQEWRLTGVGSDGWSNAPSPLDTVEAVPGGARGVVRAVQPGYLDVEWLHGRFEAGQTLRKITVEVVEPEPPETEPTYRYQVGDESQDPIITAEFKSTPNSYFGAGPWAGGFVCGNLPFDYAEEQLNVSGNVKIGPSDGSLNTAATPAWCGVIIGDDPRRRTLCPNDHNQIQIAYDLAQGLPPLRRLWTRRKYGDGDWTRGGALVPVDAACVFVHASPNPIVQDNSVNVGSIVHYTGSGQDGMYLVRFERNVVRADFIPQLTLIGPSASLKGWQAIPTVRQTDMLVVEVLNCCGHPANIPAGCALGVEIKLADI